MVKEKAHILKILKRVKKALQTNNYVKIKHLSNRIIHNASINQDPDVVSIAVIIYSLSKLIVRENYHDEKNWKNFYNDYLKNINDMISLLEENKIDEFRTEVDSNRRLIEELSGNLKHYISDVFRRAKINKASKIYEHGISMEKTAKILGISLWELTEYAGTRVIDADLTITMPVKQRIKIAEEIFSR